MKSDLINRIRSFHPGTAPPKFKSFSHYVGGMADAGGWYKEVLENQTDETLEECLALLERHDKLPMSNVTLADHRMAINRVMLFGGTKKVYCDLCGWNGFDDHKTCGYCGSSNLIEIRNE